MSKLKLKGEGTPEVTSARSKLDGVLQTLVEKKEDCSTPDKDYEYKDDRADTDLDVDSPFSTPTRGLGNAARASRKRKRGIEDATGADSGQPHHTYIIKLFDRSVDLAQFSEDMPLYPICRAWLRNQPQNRNLGPRPRSPSPEPEDSNTEEAAGYVYILPESTVKTEKGLRVPSPLPQPTEHLDINANPDIAPAPELLLLGHMDRWKQVRVKWRQAARNNELQHMDSLQILRDMYDKQLV